MNNIPKPFLGRMILEALEEEVTDYKNELYGLEEEGELAKKGFKLAQVDENIRVPLKKGRIIEMAIDCFGERYAHNYGKDSAEHAKENIKPGTTVMFIPNQTYKVDTKGQYHIIADEHIICFIKEE